MSREIVNLYCLIGLGGAVTLAGIACMIAEWRNPANGSPFSDSYGGTGCLGSFLVLVGIGLIFLAWYSTLPETLPR